MKKIEINLYPESRSSNEIKYIKYISRYFPIVFIILLICVCVNIGLFVLGGFYTLPYMRLKANWEKITPRVRAINEFKKSLDVSRQKRAEYDEIMLSAAEASHLFADIVKALPKNIWIGNIKMSENIFSFTGSVVEWKEDYAVSINKFIKNLQKEEYFISIYPRINLKGQSKSDFAGKQIMKFEVECVK